MQTVAGDRLLWFLKVGDPVTLLDTSAVNLDAISFNMSVNTLEKIKTPGAERLSGIIAYWPTQLISFFDSLKGTTLLEVVNKAAHALPAGNNGRSKVAALLEGKKRGTTGVIVGHVITNFANAALAVKALSLVSIPLHYCEDPYIVLVHRREKSETPENLSIC